MKNFLIFSLIFVLILSMAGCGCNHEWQEATCTAPKTCTRCGETEGAALTHTSGELKVVSVDTENLTITHELSCMRCGAVIESKESSTGIAPVNGTVTLSPKDWHACLATNISALGASQTFFPCTPESEDNAVIHGVMTLSGMMSVISYYDAEGNVLTTDQGETRNLIHNICMECQFTNDTAKEFYMLLMITAMNNNSALDLEAANALAGKIMGGEIVTDNGYTYSMAITSVENQTVRVDIVAE